MNLGPLHWELRVLATRPPVKSVHGIFQARMLERVAISSSRGSNLSLLCLLLWQADFFTTAPPRKPLEAPVAEFGKHKLRDILLIYVFLIEG